MPFAQHSLLRLRDGEEWRRSFVLGLRTEEEEGTCVIKRFVTIYPDPAARGVTVQQRKTAHQAIGTTGQS